MLEQAGFDDIVLNTKDITKEYAEKWGITYLDLSEYMTKTLYSARKPE